MNMNSLNLMSALPEIIVLLGLLLTLVVDLFVPARLKVLSFLTAQATLILSGIVLYQQFYQPNSFSFNQMYVQDQIAIMMKLSVIIMSFFAFIYSRHYLKLFKLQTGEFLILALSAVLGMMLLISANSLLVIFLGLELSSLPVYALVAINRDCGTASESAMKYYILGAVASGILLYGMSLLYGLTGELNLQNIFHTLQASQADHTLEIIALTFIVAGIAFKLGAAPFHMWAPDVYQGAASPVTLLISAAPKIAALGMLVRLLIEAMPILQANWQAILMIVAILSIGLGNIAAIAQTNLKRMLAYSSVAHMGYMLLGIVSGSSKGYAAALFYMISYAIMSTGAFALITMTAKVGLDLGDLKDLKGLNSRNPWLAFMMLFIMFSMAGIPPLVGFFAKLGVLEALISSHLIWLAVLALIFAVIGCYYYLAVVKVMYFEEPEINNPIDTCLSSQIALTLNGLVVLYLGLFPGLLFHMCQMAVMNS